MSVFVFLTIRSLRLKFKLKEIHILQKIQNKRKIITTDGVKELNKLLRVKSIRLQNSDKCSFTLWTRMIMRLAFGKETPETLNTLKTKKRLKKLGANIITKMESGCGYLSLIITPQECLVKMGIILLEWYKLSYLSENSRKTTKSGKRLMLGD